MLHCLGGIRVLLPLFAQLDYPALESPAPVDGARTVAPVLSHEADPNFLLTILRVFAVMLKDSPINQTFVRQSNGFAVIAYVLEQVSPRSITIRAVDALGSLLDTVSFDDSLYASCFATLLCNVQIYIYAGVEVQRHWLQLLTARACQRARPKALLRQIGGAQMLLDQLRSLCWFEQESDSQATAPELRHPISGAIIGRRPAPEQLRAIRNELLALVRVLLTPSAEDTDGALEAELCAVVYYLEHCTDEQAKQDVLKLVVDLMNAAGSQVLQMLSNIMEADRPDASLQRRPGLKLKQYHAGTFRRQGVDLFLSLLQSPLDGVRVLALHAIGKLLRSGLAIKPRDLFPTLYRFLQPHPLSGGCYIALFSIMMSEDVQARTLPSRAVGGLGRPAYSFGLDGTQTILHAAVLPVIFQLMTYTESPELNQSIMQDMAFLLSNEVNRALFLRQLGWQSWLFELVLTGGGRTVRKAPLPPHGLNRARAGSRTTTRSPNPSVSRRRAAGTMRVGRTLSPRASTSVNDLRVMNKAEWDAGARPRRRTLFQPIDPSGAAAGESPRRSPAAAAAAAAVAAAAPSTPPGAVSPASATRNERRLKGHLRVHTTRVAGPGLSSPVQSPQRGTKSRSQPSSPRGTVALACLYGARVLQTVCVQRKTNPRTARRLPWWRMR